jgi:hypothetical protein
MRYLLPLLLFFSFQHSFSQSKIVLEGAYTGQNIYIQNPYADSGFCTKKVVVNGIERNISTESAAFVIPLDSMGFKEFDTLLIEIYHKDDCKPKVITQMITPRATFEIVSIDVDSNAILHWTTKHELSELVYTIEQYRWNKWVKVGEVNGKGSTKENSYSFQAMPHSGENKFRVKQVTQSVPRLSVPATFKGPDLKVKVLNQYVDDDVLKFNKETMYELYDQEGNLMRKGTGGSVDMKGLKRGHYFINYDNRTGEIDKI